MEKQIKQNETILVGKLVKNPEIKTFGEGKEYARISVMTDIENKKTFNTITIWREREIDSVRDLVQDDTVEIIAKLIKKQSTDSNGSKLERIELQAKEVRLKKPSTQNINQVQLFGRLAKKPELQKTPNQLEYARISIAVSKYQKGAKDNSAEFFNITLWDDLAREAVKLNKADWVEFEGIIRNTKYQKDGKDIYTTELAPKMFREKVWENKETKENSSINTSQQANNDVYNDVDLGIISIEPIYDEDMPFM